MKTRGAQPEPQHWLPPQWDPSALSDELNVRLRAGVSHIGHLGRLKHVLAKADRGESIVMAGLGASVTSDFGGVAGYMQDRYKLGYIGVPKRCRAMCVKYGWLMPVFRYLTKDGSKTRNATKASSLVNCGQAARPVNNYLDCTASSVPQNVDLMIVEGSNGMSPIVGRDVVSTEKVVRRLFSLPNRPAIILLHWLDWCACRLDVCKPAPRIDRHRANFCYGPQGFNQSWIVGRRREDETGWAALAKYYQLPTLSMRLAFHPMAAGKAGTTVTSAGPLLKSPQEFTWDGLHPRPCTKGWQGCEYIMLISALVNRFLADVKQGHIDGDSSDTRRQHTLPCSPLKSRARERSGPMVERCFGWGIDRRVPPPVTNVSGWKHTTMDTANSFDPPEHCQARRRKDSLVNDTSQVPRPCPIPKDGFTAFHPGSFAVLELPLSSGSKISLSERQRAVSWKAKLDLTYLSSYEGMGVAAIRCARGCACEMTRINAHRSSEFTSLWQKSSFPVVVSPDHGNVCEVKLVLEAPTGMNSPLRQASYVKDVPRSSSRAGTKFKLSSVVLRWAAEDEWNTQIAQQPERPSSSSDKHGAYREACLASPSQSNGKRF